MQYTVGLLKIFLVSFNCLKYIMLVQLSKKKYDPKSQIMRLIFPWYLFSPGENQENLNITKHCFIKSILSHIFHTFD